MFYKYIFHYTVCKKLKPKRDFSFSSVQTHSPAFLLSSLLVGAFLNIPQAALAGKVQAASPTLFLIVMSA